MGTHANRDNEENRTVNGEGHAANGGRATALQGLVERLEALASLSPDGAATSLLLPVTIHDTKGELLYVAPSVAGLLGVSAEAGQAGLIDAIHVQDRVQLAHFLGNAADAGTGNLELRLHPRIAGAGAWVEMELARVGHCATGSPNEEQFLLVSWRDISRRKNSEAALREAREKAEESNVAKTRFFANVSHELRTPLNAILGFSELLNSPLGESIGPTKRIEYISLVHQSASHLLSLLNAILDMSKIETGMYEIFPETFNLSDCVENTVAMMKGQAEMKNINLRCDAMSELPEIVADKRAVRQILINLVSNAIKFTDEKGSVRVSAARRARTVSIMVDDDGIGISPENIERLGTPFFQADSKYDRKYEGTGIGLSVVKGLVELHGGSLTVESARGEGTRVIVTLPINQPRGRGIPANEQVEKITEIRTRPANAGPASSSLSGVGGGRLRNSA